MDEPTNRENYRLYTDDCYAIYSLNKRSLHSQLRSELKLDTVADRLLRLGVRTDEYILRLAHGSMSATLLKPDFDEHIWSKYEMLDKHIAHVLRLTSEREKQHPAIKILIDCCSGMLTHVSRMKRDLVAAVGSSSADLRWGLDPRPRVLPNRRQTIDRPRNAIVLMEH